MTTSGDNDITGRRADAEAAFTMPRVAYTLNDSQPVRSTYIAHDPFFFMDMPEDEIRAIEGLGEENADDSLFCDPAYFIETGDNPDRVAEILTDFDMNCAFLQEESDLLDFPTIEEALAALKQSRYAAALHTTLLDKGVRFRAHNGITKAVYSRSENVITAPETLTLTSLMATLLAAMREAYLSYQGAAVPPLSLYPDHAVLVFRAHQADRAAAVIRTAWELKLSGEEAMWQMIARGSLSDLCGAFAHEAARDFRTLNNGAAQFAAFECWFLTDRVRMCDRTLIQRMLSEYHGHEFHEESLSAMIVIDILRAMGEQPLGKNVLAQYIPMLTSDPIFTEVRERSNANFLWFVKFEKSFREVERSLQPETDLSGDVIPSDPSMSPLSSKPKGRHIHERTYQTASLLQFPDRGRAPAGSEQRAASGQKDGATVISFDIVNRPFNTKQP